MNLRMISMQLLGDYESAWGEISIYLAQQFSTGDPFVNSKGVEYALIGDFTWRQENGEW